MLLRVEFAAASVFSTYGSDSGKRSTITKTRLRAHSLRFDSSIFTFIFTLQYADGWQISESHGKTTVMNETGSRRAPLAYENEQFVKSPDGRILRILAEYSEPLSRFRREQIQDTVVFFGSARFHSRTSAQNNLSELEQTKLRLSEFDQLANEK